MNKKDIPGYEGIYAATEDGHIWSYKTNKFLNQSLIHGYYFVHLITNKDIRIAVHKLIALTYLKNPENKLTVDHIDRNPLNNNVSNLRWATFSEQNINKEWSEKRQQAVNKAGLVHSKKIECRDKNNHNILINTFSSAYQAAIQMFNDPQKNSLIHRCAKGLKSSAYGYWWTYTQE